MRRSLILAAAILAACLLLVPDAQAGCVPGEGECPLEPPQSEEVNPDPGGSTSLLAGEVAHPGSALPVVLAMPLPRVVPARAVQGVQPPAPVVALPVPMRYQDPADGGDVSCGVQALGMALDGLGGAAPTSGAITDLLQRAGMLYSFGTGVEELAFAAQAYGYAGSLALHDGTLDDLRAQLDLGRPVVVGLGTNGAGQPGHFVTVTGISADGAWVVVNDPAVGPQTLPLAEFLRLWDLQGNSGVVVAQEPPAAPDGSAADSMPWVALMAGVMALVSTTPLALQRKGIGGHANPPHTGGHWVWKEVPVYETVMVQDGTEQVLVEVPRYRTVREEVVEIVDERVAVTRTVQKQDGWITTVERQPVYAAERYISGYRTVTRQVPEYITIGKRKKLVGYSTETSREPVYATRTVQTGWRAVESQVPRMVTVEEFDHWQMEPREVRRWVERQVPSGFDKVVQVVPRMVERQVQVGTEWKWVWEEGDGDAKGSVQAPLSGLDLLPVAEWRSIEQGEEGRSLPNPLDMPFVDIPELVWDVRGFKLVRAADKAKDAAALAFRELDGGYVSVSAPVALREEFKLAGTRYLPTTVAEATGTSLVRSAVSGSSLIVSGIGSSVLNLYEYGLGEHKEEGIGSQQFWVSTGVDFALSVGIGTGSALVIAGVAAIAAAAFTAAIAAPVLVIGAALVGLGGSILLDIVDVPDSVKSAANEFVDARDAEMEQLENAPEQRVAPKAPPIPIG